MKRILLPVAVLVSLPVIALAVPAPKVTICHATSADTNPYTRIVVSSNAIGGHFDNPGTPKAGHEQDLLLQGEQDCPPRNTPPVVVVPPTTQPPLVTPQTQSVTPPVETPAVVPPSNFVGK